MNELGLDTASATYWFPEASKPGFILIEVTDAHAEEWANELRDAVRRCYIDDAKLAASAESRGVSSAEVLASRLPDPGSVMAGDFGEILTYIYQAVAAFPQELLGPKKWRLKQDRRKPAPYSDVVQFVVPNWPSATSDDSVYCSESKTKSTSANSLPIESAIRDSEKDQIGRLAGTLVWLRERALTEDLGAVKIPLLERFINATEFPPAKHHFFAVAIICSSFALAELSKIDTSKLSAKSKLIVITVPNLKSTYTAVFDQAVSSVSK